MKKKDVDLMEEYNIEHMKKKKFKGTSWKIK